MGRQSSRLITYLPTTYRGGQLAEKKLKKKLKIPRAGSINGTCKRAPRKLQKMQAARESKATESISSLHTKKAIVKVGKTVIKRNFMEKLNKSKVMRFVQLFSWLITVSNCVTNAFSLVSICISPHWN